MKKWFGGFLLMMFFFLTSGLLPAKGQVAQSLKTLEPTLVKTPPMLDGVLDDEAWRGGPLVDDNWITYNPVDGDLFPQKTEVYLAYDTDNLYFAFYCHDTDPAKIKTAITKRDNFWAEDWVGFSLDAIGNRQMGYELFVNPKGIQGDIQLTGNGEDDAPDWVWYSAGKMVDDGYVIEIRLPLKSIRFTSGKNRELAILFWRRISRLNMSGAWPQLVPGKGVFNSMAKIVYGNLNRQLKLELLPAMTYASGWDRVTPGSSWSDADDALKFGLGLKYGITSSITAEATVNPDFSQVESDSFQVTVNQRYPIFYSEKRPFFMELASLFSLSGNIGPASMGYAVHTRRIADPRWGVRLNGEQGQASFAFLAAADRSAGQAWEEGENPNLGRNATFWIGRGKYSLGGDNFLGVLYSGREFAGEYNRTVAGDASFRFLKNHQLVASFLHSFDGGVEGKEKTEGNYLIAHYIFSSRNTWLGVMAEHVDPDFRMDSAYIQRTGITDFQLSFSQGLVPDKKKLPWLIRVEPSLYAAYIHDVTSGLDDKFMEVGLGFYLPKQAYVGVIYKPEQESWAGQVFQKKTYFASGQVQPTKWLNLHSCLHLGDSIYYDPVNPFLGKRLQWHVNAKLQPNDRLNLFVENILTRFSQQDDTPVYTENILLGRLTYQFNKFLFVRALVQYDSYFKVVLSDLLASFTLIPGTVVHLGYGSLHEKQEWQQDQWEKEIAAGGLFQTRQSLFFKVSYLYQF